MTKQIVKVGSFFSGIGAPEKALSLLKKEKVIKDYEVMFFSEIDEKAVNSYCLLHNIDKKLNLGDITKIKGIDLPYCDLWIGGFPCQDISTAGVMRGFEAESNTRSSLGWEMIRLLKEVKQKPNYVVFENVTNIASKKFKPTLDLFKKDLINLGYTLYDSILDATDFGIPQMRKRYFLVAILDSNKTFNFPLPIKNNVIFKDYSEDNVDEKYYLSSNEYDEFENKRIFYKKTNKNTKYIIDMDKYKTGGLCGNVPNCKFYQSARIYSENGVVPTITASNTADNWKLVVRG